MHSEQGKSELTARVIAEAKRRGLPALVSVEAHYHWWRDDGLVSITAEVMGHGTFFARVRGDHMAEAFCDRLAANLPHSPASL